MAPAKSRSLYPRSRGTSVGRSYVVALPNGLYRCANDASGDSIPMCLSHQTPKSPVPTKNARNLPFGTQNPTQPILSTASLVMSCLTSWCILRFSLSAFRFVQSLPPHCRGPSPLLEPYVASVSNRIPVLQPLQLSSCAQPTCVLAE